MVIESAKPTSKGSSITLENHQCWSWLSLSSDLFQRKHYMDSELMPTSFPYSQFLIFTSRTQSKFPDQVLKIKFDRKKDSFRNGGLSVIIHRVCWKPGYFINLILLGLQNLGIDQMCGNRCKKFEKLCINWNESRYWRTQHDWKMQSRDIAEQS